MEGETVEAIFNQRTSQPFDVLFTKDNPYPPNEWKRNIAYNFEKMRQAVLQGYDKAWVVESDIIPPLDALDKLLEVDAPIVTGLYTSRHGNPYPNVMRFGSELRGLGGAMNWEEVRAAKGQTVQTSGGCTGCLVIDRTVLEGFSFAEIDKHIIPDSALMDYCFHKGIKQMARLDVVCGHKEPNGNILRPETFIGEVQ